MTNALSCLFNHSLWSDFKGVLSENFSGAFLFFSLAIPWIQVHKPLNLSPAEVSLYFASYNGQQIIVKLVLKLLYLFCFLSLLSEREHISWFCPIQTIVNWHIFAPCDGCISSRSYVIFCLVTICTKISLQSSGLIPLQTRAQATAVPSSGEVWDWESEEFHSHAHVIPLHEMFSPALCRQTSIWAENAFLG